MIFSLFKIHFFNHLPTLYGTFLEDIIIPVSLSPVFKKDGMLLVYPVTKNSPDLFRSTSIVNLFTLEQILEIQYNYESAISITQQFSEALFI